MDFKELLYKLKIYIILGIIFLGCIILYAGLGTRASSPNIYFVIIGSLILSPFIVYLIYLKIKTKKEEKHRKLELLEFKKNAEKIPVNLENLTIKSNKWNKTIVTDRTQYAGFNELMGNAERNTKTITQNFNHINIQIPYRGRILDYNVSIPMDTTNLKIHFAIKKETIFYIDPVDENKFYLDLEFLK